MIFLQSDTPRVFGVAPGADFPKTVYQNLIHLCEGHPPQVLAKVDVLVPSQRMKRRLQQLFEEGDARLLPRIGTITDVTHLLPGATLPTAASNLRRRLELKAVVEKLVELEPTLSKASTIGLTESLAKVLDEFSGEGVSLDSLDALDTWDESEHFGQSLTFLKAIRGYSKVLNAERTSGEDRHRQAVQLLIKNWEAHPPHRPLIVAGSTGSRDTTRLLMQAVASLPQGAVVLPGFDAELPAHIWTSLKSSRENEDHPQFRFAHLMKRLDFDASQVVMWGDSGVSSRNRLISLAMRPASFTNLWRSEGMQFRDLREVTRSMTLLEVAQPRDEALCIAAAMCHAVGQGKRVAMISPDATLSRRVNVALERWDIKADDSGGTPLHLSSAGRYFRHVGALIDGKTDSASLIALLKHPLSQNARRGPFQLFVQELELFMRDKAIAEVNQKALHLFGAQNEAMQEWVGWCANHLKTTTAPLPRTLAASVEHHVSLAEAICGNLALWDGSDGEALKSIVADFRREGDFGEPVTFSEYLQLFERQLAAESDREKLGVRPDVTIWGTLEARVQGADLVILGGLNEGVWPAQIAPDPWLNRQMRSKLGLLLPERQIGLAAHDFQQATGAPEVILSRARRSDDSETVPSRWLNRLSNLLSGLTKAFGPEAYFEMKQRGDAIVAAARQLDVPDAPIAPETRPAPAPPAHVRPSEYSVTEIKTLIRDPYAIYAKRILKLRALNPLTPVPDARLKGIVVHEVLEHFYALNADFSARHVAFEKLADLSARILKAHVPWPATRLQWQSQLLSIFDHLFDTEVDRRATTTQLAREISGIYQLKDTPFRIKGKADRIDSSDDGLLIYDYKTGGPPEAKEIEFFDRQLMIEAVMAEHGAFGHIAPETVAKVIHLGMGRNPKNRETPLTDHNETGTVAADLIHLLTKFSEPSTGYIARRAMETLRYGSDYDHLSRFGEWDQSEISVLEQVP